MLRLSRNLQNLPRLSFTHTKISQFQIKEQPKEFCLSTIESTQTILELLNDQGLEVLEEGALKNFIDPFTSMVAYQIKCATNNESNTARFIKRD